MPPTVKELTNRSFTRIAYVLFLEGLPVAFTDEQQLVGSGAGGAFTWIGITHGDRSVVLGLRVPESVTFSTSLHTGMMSTDDSISIGITDFQFAGSNLIKLMQDVDAERVAERLGPKDSPAPETLLDTANPANDVHIWGKWLNQEAIGQFGERRRWQVFPGDPLPGYDHAAMTGETAEAMAPSAVYDLPTFFRGRKVALYKIYKDVTDPRESYLAWPNWQLQYESGYSLVWWGTVDEVGAEGREWKLRCRGPSSWLRQMLNINRTATWAPVFANLVLKNSPAQREDLMLIDCYYRSPGGIKAQGAFSLYVDPDDVLPLVGEVDDFVNAINARLQVVLATTNTITWTVTYSGSGKFNKGSVNVKIADGSNYCAIFKIALHEKVWRFLGWDPILQNQATPDQTTWVQFAKAGGLVVDGLAIAAPMPHGYYVGTFHTLPLGMTTPEEAADDCDNGGKMRTFVTLLNKQVGVTMLWPEARQFIAVGGTSTPPYNEGQLNRPPIDVVMTVDGLNDQADRTGYMAFRGKYREKIDDDPKDMVQIAKVSWANDPLHRGETYSGGSERRWVFIERWMDPRWFGVDCEPLQKVWSAADGDIEFCPMAYLGYRSDDAADRADLQLLRMMLSTGTASWSGYEYDNPTRTLGVNAHPDAAFPDGSDAEIADLGLGIYHGLIDAKSFTAAADDLPGGASSPLNRCKYATIGPIDSQEIISLIIQARGWAMGMRGGKYSLWSLSAPLSLDDVDVTLTPTDFDSRDNPFVEQVNLTPIIPIDKYTVTYGASVVGFGGSEDELQYVGRTADPGASIRHSNAERQVNGQGLVPNDLFPPNIKPPTWQSYLRKRWVDICNWRAQPNVMIVGLPIRPSKAKDLHVGTVVVLSSQWGPTRDGQYGLAGKLGRVVRVQRSLQPGPTRVDILIQPGDPTRTRRFGPSAQVLDMVSTLEERIDAATRTIWCYRDYRDAGLPADKYDTKYFCEPAWSPFGGGNALVQGWQHDGREWSKTFTFKAEAVGQADDRCWIRWEAGTFAGKFWERRYTQLFLERYDLQTAAWVRAIFLVNVRSDHKFGAGPTKGFKFV